MTGPIATPIARGAGQCPKCASRRVTRRHIHLGPTFKFYAGILEFCLNCKAIWEPFAVVDLLDAADPTSSFKEPCDNCAFRPGSVEQRNVETWTELLASLKAGSSFYCHKGVPQDPASADGFAYPRDRAGKPIPHKLRFCRGFLRMTGAIWDKEKQQGLPSA